MDCDNQVNISPESDLSHLLPRPPDGGYGWVIAGAVSAITAVTWGMNTAFGVYVSFSIQHDHFKGGTPLGYAGVGGLSVGVAMICTPLANYGIAHLGFRALLAIGALMVVVGQILAGICQTFATYLVCQGLIFGLGLGIILVASQPLLAQWFDRRLSLAQGIANGGAGLGGLIFANTTRILIEKLSFKQSLIINGCISAGVLIPALSLLRTGPADVGSRELKPLQMKWLHNPGFVWICLWGSFAMMGYFIMLYSMAPYATDGIGLSQTQAAALQSMLAAGLMIGRPVTGLTLDLGGRLNMALLTNLVAALTCWAFWLPANSFALLAVFAFTQGFTGGSVWSAAAPVIAQVAGASNLTSALGLFWVAVAVPAALSNIAALALVDYSRTHLGKGGRDAYQMSIALCGGLFFMSGVCLYGSKVCFQKTFKIWQIS